MASIINKLLAKEDGLLVSDYRKIDLPRDNNPITNRQCVDCKKPSQVQCLHCSKNVCMERAQKHVDHGNEKWMSHKIFFDNKLTILDRLSAEAKEHVRGERNRIVQQADVEQNQAFTQIDQFTEQQKKLIKEKSKELSQQSLDRISGFIEQMTHDWDFISETNQQFSNVFTILPKIHVQYRPR